MPVPKENLFVSLPTKVRSQVDRAAKRSSRSRSQIVRDALSLYFKLHGVADEEPSAEERAAIAEGERAYEQGEFIALDAWQHAVGLGDQQAGIGAAARIRARRRGVTLGGLKIKGLIAEGRR